MHNISYCKNKAVIHYWSFQGGNFVVVLCSLFMVSEFRVAFGLLSGHLLGNSCSLGSLCILTICNFSYFPFWFLGLDLGSDCFSSWSLHTVYF